MNRMRLFGVAYSTILSVFAFACGAQPGELEATNDDTSALTTAYCKKAEPKDILIAQMVKDSLAANYPLTRLEVGQNGTVQGPDLPDVMVGDLGLINSIPEARTAVARAVSEVSGLPDYVVGSISNEQAACSSVPAWTPTGQTTASTTAISVTTTENEDSWHETHKAFAKVSALLKRFGNKDIVDPPGDGSTNLPPSGSVSSTGVVANAYGFCPAGTSAGTFCKLSYATGVNYMGRKCQYYYGYLRCLLY
ncbi:MAG TPA: hypothetical protein VFQ61_08780 [Polyangiaceae bacterium]|nr:hypothetical protein [Polyangiaceae bacterium]